MKAIRIPAGKMEQALRELGDARVLFPSGAGPFQGIVQSSWMIEILQYVAPPRTALGNCQSCLGGCEFLIEVNRDQSQSIYLGQQATRIVTLYTDDFF